MRSIAATVVAVALAACGGSSPAPQGPTAATVAVRSSDLPSGLTRCDLSGDINSFLEKEKTPDPSTYTSTKNEWQSAQSKGATAAYTTFFTDGTPHCAAIKTNGSDIGSANYPLVVNFVVQFKDEKSAAKGYTSEAIFGFSASSLKSGGAPVIEGTQTGLTQNSIVLSTLLPPQSYYIAVWQNKAFMVILAILNVDAAAAKKAALAENGRIK